ATRRADLDVVRGCRRAPADALAELARGAPRQPHGRTPLAPVTGDRGRGTRCPERPASTVDGGCAEGLRYGRHRSWPPWLGRGIGVGGCPLEVEEHSGDVHP